MASPIRRGWLQSRRRRGFYCRVMDVLESAGVPFLVGGTYAWGHYTEMERDTKDFDLFLMASDVPVALDRLRQEGLRAELAFSHWLAKVFEREAFVDLIFNSGNALCPVDRAWFEHAVRGEAFGRPVLLCPVEEIIWQKSFIMERERFDGGDVAHLIRAQGDQLDWGRLVHRFQDQWRVLLSHLVLFGFIYPGERDKVPAEVLRGLLDRLARERPIDPAVCCGPLLSRAQYLIDIHHWGYRDARISPSGPMSEGEIAAWTDEVIRDTDVVRAFPGVTRSPSKRSSA